MNNDISILIVGDSPLEISDLKSKVLSLGFKVAGVAESAKDAIAFVREEIPDLILMDIKLNGEMDGIVASAIIHEENDVPVIFTANYSDSQTMDEVKNCDPYGYIIKPFNEVELNVNIQIALKRYEKTVKAKENEYKYRLIFEQSKDSIYITGKDRIISECNSSFTKFLGCKKTEIIGKSLDSFFEDKRCAEKYRKVLKEKKFIKNEEIVFRKKDGSEICGSVTSGRLLSAEKRITGYHGIVRDLTEKKENIQNMKKTLDGIIQAMALTVEVRDPYTSGHQKRVSILAAAIAEKLSCSEDVIEGVKMAGMIHDLGKINIPSEILSKPVMLSTDEFSLIKGHPEVGYTILKELSFPWPIAAIIQQHHERIDGSGYPDGLSGENILDESKIISVADVVEAMASHRPYRPSHGLKEALHEIEKYKGSKFDSDVVDACISLCRENNYDIQNIFSASDSFLDLHSV